MSTAQDTQTGLTLSWMELLDGSKQLSTSSGAIEMLRTKTGFFSFLRGERLVASAKINKIKFHYCGRSY